MKKRKALEDDTDKYVKLSDFFEEDTTTGEQQRETMTSLVVINIKHQGVNLLPGKGQVKSMQPKTQNKHT